MAQKVVINLSIEYEDFEFLLEVKNKYRLKNTSQALQAVFRHYRNLCKDREEFKQKAQEFNPQRHKVVNPQTLG